MTENEKMPQAAEQVTENEPMTQAAPEAQAEPIGSLKNGGQNEPKTFYTPEEVDRLSSRDLDDPTVFQNVRNSMRQWK